MILYQLIEYTIYLRRTSQNVYPHFRQAHQETYKELLQEHLQVHFRYINIVLSEQNYLVENRFSVSDAYLFTVMRWRAVVKARYVPLSGAGCLS
ncbi:MAG: glutathione S-transferase family protein [Symbiopectobacterium sp.]